MTASRHAAPDQPPVIRARLSLVSRLSAPIDSGPLIFFRILFGLVIVWEVLRYFSYGWIERYYVQPSLHFTYFGFDWVRPWPTMGMYLHFAVTGAVALCVALGLWYRVTSALLFVLFTYIFLLEQAVYLNHLYLVCLLCFLLIFLPAHREWSLDVKRRPSLRSITAPAWTLLLLRVQLGIVYVYGGLAKLNADWVQGEPMRTWLAKRKNYAVIGPYVTEEWFVAFFTWGGILLDLLIVPCLLWRPTRWLALAGATAFHLTNAMVFRIGIFPWLMLGATALFFPAAWWSRLRRGPGARPATHGPGRRSARRDARVDTRELPRTTTGGEHAHEAPASPARGVVMVLLGVYFLWQLLFPLRHFLYPGNVSWTEEGHRFAWHMKLRDKVGQARFVVTDPGTGQQWRIDPAGYMRRWQLRRMVTHPDMILQFSHYLADDFRRRGHPDVEVRANVAASLNGRRPQPLIDPAVDLTTVRRGLRPADWIVPLYEELRRGQSSETDDAEESDD